MLKELLNFSPAQAAIVVGLWQAIIGLLLARYNYGVSLTAERRRAALALDSERFKIRERNLSDRKQVLRDLRHALNSAEVPGNLTEQHKASRPAVVKYAQEWQAVHDQLSAAYLRHRDLLSASELPKLDAHLSTARTSDSALQEILARDTQPPLDKFVKLTEMFARDLLGFNKAIADAATEALAAVEEEYRGLLEFSIFQEPPTSRLLQFD